MRGNPSRGRSIAQGTLSCVNSLIFEWNIRHSVSRITIELPTRLLDLQRPSFKYWHPRVLIGIHVNYLLASVAKKALYLSEFLARIEARSPAKDDQPLKSEFDHPFENVHFEMP